MDHLWVIVVFACLLSYKAKCVGYQCYQDGWVVFRNSCYLFADDKNISWTAATHYCASHENSHIVTIESQSEELFLRDQCQRLFKQGASRDNWFWIGATDDEVEGVWVWYNNHKPITDGYMNWYPGEPDDAHNSLNEDCAVLWGPWGFKWGDWVCEKTSHVICERNFTGATELEIIG